MKIHAARSVACGLLAAFVWLPAPSAAQETGCRSIVSNMERLACYDRSELPASPASAAVAPDGDGSKDKLATFRAGENDRQRSQNSALTDSWELDAASKRGVFVLRPYKPMFILPLSYTNKVNQTPSSSAPDHTVVSPNHLKAGEAKFQLSVKTKAVENLFGDNGDLWLGYTQSSRWQVYNQGGSRPFRETNYEPEAMLVFRTDYEVFGFKGRMASIGVNHQSNGRAEPLSRNWNRVIAQLGFERDDWMVMLRPWWRLPEDGESDDNPGLENYMGRGELTVARKWQGHVFSLQARHSLRGGENSHGSAQLAWSFPIAGDLKGYVQLFSGYGESLIDFNHRQTVLGLGFSVMDWF
jgi:phospholipase A1